MLLAPIIGTIRFVNQAAPELTQVALGLNQLGAASRRLGMSLTLLGTAMYTSLTLPLKGLIKIGIDFEHQFANVAKTVSGWDLDIFGKWTGGAKEFREQLRGMARELPFTHKELAEIAAFGGQFGVAKDQLANFTEVVAKLGTAVDGIEAETAAKGLAQIAHITGTFKKDPEKGFERLASTLVDLGNKGISTEGTILEITRRMSGAGQVAGMAAHEMFGWSAAIANLGHRSELGGNALSNTILKISRAVSEGGEKLAAFAKISGMTAEQFKKDWGKDASATLATMISRLAALPKAMQAAKIGELFGINVRQNQVMLTLVATQSLLTATLWDAKHAYEANAALQAEFTTKAHTLENQLIVLKNRFYDIAITIAQPFMDAIRRFITSMDPWIKSLEDLAKWFEQLDEDTQQWIVTLTLLGVTVIPALILALGGLLWVIGSIAGILGSVTMSMVAFSTAASSGSPALIAFTGVISQLTGLLPGLLTLLGRLGAAAGVLLVAWNIYKAIQDLKSTPELKKTAEDINSVAKETNAATKAMSEYATTQDEYTDAQNTYHREMTLGKGVLLDYNGYQKKITEESQTWGQWFSSWTGYLISANGAWKDLKRTVSEFIGLFSFSDVSWSGMDLMLTLLDKVQMVSGKVDTLPEVPLFDKETGKRNARPFGGYLDQVPEFTLQNPALAKRDRFGRIDPSSFQFGTEAEFNKNWDMHQADIMQRHLEGVQRKFDADAAAAETAKEKAKRLAAELKKAKDAYDALHKMEEQFGLGDAEKFFEDLKALQYMKDLGITPSLDFMMALGEGAQKTIKYFEQMGQDVPNTWRYMAMVSKESIEAINKPFLEMADPSKVSEKLAELGLQMYEMKSKFEDAKFDLVIERQTNATVRSLMELENTWVKTIKEMNDNPPQGIDTETWEAMKNIINQINLEKMQRVVRESKEFQAILVVLKTIAPAAAAALEDVFNAAGGIDEGEDKTEKKVKKTITAFEGWQKSLKDLVSGFNKLKTIMGDTFKGSFLEKVAELVNFMSVGAEIGDQFADGLAQAIGNIENMGKFLDPKDESKGKGSAAGAVAGMISMAMAAVQAYALLSAATDKASKAQRILGGMLTGAAMGAAFGAKAGPWGIIIGAVVGLVVGAFRKVPWAEIGKRVGNDFGVAISDELAKTIKADADKLFGGDWQTAALYHLKEIIQQAGGIGAENFLVMTARLRDVFVMLEQGRMTAEQVRDILDETFDQFLKEATDSLGFVNDRFLEIIDLSLRMGVNSKKVKEYYKGISDELVDILNTLGGMMPRQDAWMKMGETIKETRKAIEELNKVPIAERDDEWTKSMAKETDKLNKALNEQGVEAAAAATQMENLGLVMAGVFFSAVAAGRSINQAMRDAKDGLDAYFGALEALGLTPTDPLIKFLKMQYDLNKAIPNTIAGVDALGQAITAMANMGPGVLTEDMFRAIEKTGYDAYVAIQGQVHALGGTTRDALIPMQGYLQRAEYEARRLGIPLDENTQMMIAQSQELGIWKALGPTPMEGLIGALNTLITRLDVLFQMLINTPEAPNPFANWVMPNPANGNPYNPSDPNHPAYNPIWDPNNAQYNPDIPNPYLPHSVGTMGLFGDWFHNYGGGTPAILHGNEAVLTQNQALPFAANVLKNLAPAGGGGSNSGQPTYLVLPDRTILARVVVEDMPDELRRRGIKTLSMR